MIRQFASSMEHVRRIYVPFNNLAENGQGYAFLSFTSRVNARDFMEQYHSTGFEINGCVYELFGPWDLYKLLNK